MIDVAVLREIWRNLEGIATRNSQRVKIEPLCFSLAYDGDTFDYCSPHIISHLGLYTDYPRTATLLISPAYRHYMGKDSYAVLKKTDVLF